MPLSEEELRLLEQMERALVAEDPKLASTLRGTEVRRHARRRVMLAAFVFVIGIALLMSGAIIREPAVGIVGFVVMLGSAYFALVAWRGQSAAAKDEGGATAGRAGLSVVQGGKSAKRSKGRSARRNQPMMERFEERWRRRREQNGGM